MTYANDEKLGDSRKSAAATLIDRPVPAAIAGTFE
jgi:hypothetical protein